jgi:predicted DNA-binding protein
MAKVLVSIYPEKEQLKRLDRLSAKTGVTKAKYVREGVDLVLKKYEEQTKERYNKRR